MTFWERSRIGWHAAWYGVLLITAVAVVVLQGFSGSGVLAVAVLAAAAGWYALLGVRLLAEDRPGPTSVARYAAYTGGITGCLLGVSLLVGPGVALPMLFVFFPQAWAMVDHRGPATVVVVLSPAVLALGQIAHQGWARTSVVDALVTAFLQSAAAIVLGWWITGLTRESEERAALVAELTAAREHLAEAEHARGVLAERERLAGEIHDTLAQGFTSIVALTQAADAALGTDPGLARQRLALIESTARANLAEARAIVAAMVPPELHGTGPGPARLAGALDRLAARSSAEDGLTVAFEAPPVLPPLRSEAEVVLLRAAQEGVTNARRHGRAGRVVLALAVDVEGVELTVTDDGCGLGPEGAAGPRAGYGLAAMAARAGQVGGSAELGPRTDGTGAGCVLRVRVPS
ncbi:sensor histidine kinase [Kineococcus gynurae]|uniref:histidine kinase n=1 Tax=Kineococcus gynurae TaxID=452979 RepID=A0ABV5LN15_9ACTN